MIASSPADRVLATRRNFLFYFHFLCHLLLLLPLRPAFILNAAVKMQLMARFWSGLAAFMFQSFKGHKEMEFSFSEVDAFRGSSIHTRKNFSKEKIGFINCLKL